MESRYKFIIILLFICGCREVNPYKVTDIEYPIKGCICHFYYEIGHTDGEWTQDSCGKFQIGDDIRKYSK